MNGIRLFVLSLCLFMPGCSSITPQQLEAAPAVKLQYSVPRNYEAALKGVMDKWNECANTELFRRVEVYPELGEGRVVVYADFTSTCFLIKTKKTGPNSCIADVYAFRNQPKRLEIIRRGLFGEQMCN